MLSASAIHLDQSEKVSFGEDLTLCHKIPTFNDYDKNPFKNIVGKGENAGNQHFLLFHNVFYPSQKEFLLLSYIFLLSANAFSLDQSKNLAFGGVISLPNDKFIDWSKLKAFADDKIKMIKKLKFYFGKVENIVGKGEIAGYQHFLLLPQCFLKVSLTRSLKVPIVW